ncbi:glycine-rich protein [Candidatus Saccharibacteria bacterium]|nr:glycine-rich protein [Candidatus Saccharibacteria bacterium]
MIRFHKTSFLRRHRYKVAFVASFAVFVGVLGFILASTNITDITPDRGPSRGGQNIIITGSGFTDYTVGAPTNFTSTGCSTYTIPANGYYQLETWGAAGGNAGAFAGGRGGYSTGTVYLSSGTNIWACVGGAGSQASRTSSAPYPGGANGGGGAYRTDNGTGHETASGGGGTDIRIGINSLYARAIVAGGGGGASGNQWNSTSGGAGGGLTSFTSGDQAGGVATQTSGGANNVLGCAGQGAFGAAVNCPFSTAINVSGGGGGWFGGGSGLNGAGGSGFVFTSSNVPSNTAIGGAYLLGSQYQAFNAATLDGSTTGTMPAPNGGTQAGQSGNGYARITQLPYLVTVGGNPCKEVNIISDTQISCLTPAHSAGVVDVAVTIGSSTYIASAGYTYTDALVLTGPTTLSGTGAGGNYTVSLDYNYTGTVTLTDGGMGGTFSGANVVGGNQLVFTDQTSRTFTYTPPSGYSGLITLLVDSGNSYVDNATLNITITTIATTFSMQCMSEGTTGAWAANAFLDPGTPLDCRIILNGSYNGTISLADTTGETETSVLGGTFTSSDPRLSSSGVFTTTLSDTADLTGQVLAFTYTSPSWDYIIDNLYDDTEANGYYLFWPIITGTSSGSLAPAQRSVSVGLLAQSYEIYSLDNPPIDENHGCVGCSARFGLSTFNAPYFGSITLSSDLDGNFDRGSGSSTPTLEFTFNGSGIDETFRYIPAETGEHTLSGESDDPAIDDSDITFDVIDSHIALTCVPSAISRGQSSDCTLSINPSDLDPGGVVSLSDIFLSYSIPEAAGDGTFTDTSALSGTFNPSTLTYEFCGGIGGTLLDCLPGEAYDRTFTYTLPSGTDPSYSIVRIQADGANITSPTIDANWALINIIPDDILFFCSDISPDCETSRVGLTQDYILRPNGLFAGQVQISAPDDPTAEFSDDGLATWNFSGDDFDFTYTPGSTGVKTLIAEVIRVDDPNSGIKVGDTYTLTVYVMGDTITITGPDTLARDEVPLMPRFITSINGPFIGTLYGRIVRHEGSSEIQFDNSVLTGTSNFTDNGNGTFTCEVSLDNYDPITNTTTACMADSAQAEGFIFDYNWFEIHISADDATILPASKTVGLVANRYSITRDGLSATTSRASVAFGAPLTFTLTPNALFAGTYSFDDNGALGYFTPPGSIVRTQSQWPATNDQTMQAQTFTYVPQQTGYIDITVDAIRETALAPAGQASMGIQTIELLVLANSAQILGPDTLVKGSTETFTLVLNGPYEGTILLGESSTDEFYDSSKLAPNSCVLTLDDYDPITNTTSCEFTFTSEFAQYGNVITLFSSPFDATKDINILATDFTVEPGPELIDQKMNNPITFTITPNAQFDGDFNVAMVSPPIADGVHTCPDPSGFTGTFSSDQISYSYDDYLTVGQNPVSKTFTFTPTSFGRACFLITPDSSDGRTIAPQMIEVHVFDTMAIGGPDTIKKGQTSGTYTLSLRGELEGTINLSIWDLATNTEITGAEIISSDGDATCTFTSDDAIPDTEISTCTFNFTLPSSYTGNRIQIRAVDADSTSLLDPDTHNVAVVAFSFSVSPSIVYDADLDTPIEFTITPDSLYAGTFSLSDDSGSGIFDTSTVAFSTSEWPSGNTPMPGQTFYYSPERYGWQTITVTSDLGTETVDILVLADTMSLTGTSSIQIDSEMIGYYLLNIHGPYIGRVNLAILDATTNLPIAGATVNDTGTGGAYCETSAADYNTITNRTPCEFSITLPANYSSSRQIKVVATTDTGSRSLPDASATTNILANDFILSPSTTQIAVAGTTLTFTITPNSIFNGNFSISTDGPGTLSASTLAFTADDINRTFTITTTAPGVETITVSSSLGTKTVIVETMADGMSLTGTAAIQISPTMSGTYRLIIPGPYVGTINFTATDPATGSVITGATFSNSGSCTVSETDLGTTLSGATICDFTVGLPANYSGSHYLRITAAVASGDPPLTLAAPALTAITANNFSLSPDTTQTGTIGTPITFTITPNSVYNGAFNIGSTGIGGATVSVPTVSFGLSDYPTTSKDPVGKTFTFTPTTPGIRTISVSDPFTATPRLVDIITFATTLDVSGPSRIQRGATSELYTLSINGPYDGTATILAYLPTGDGTSGPAADVALSRTTCTFTIDDYDITTNTTTCTFTVSVPHDIEANHIGISAAAPGLSGDPHVAITATDFTFTADTTEGVVGTPITFTITPNGLFDGTFNLSDGGMGGIFSPTQVVFDPADWPVVTDHALPAGLTFTYTPTRAGSITITAHDIDTGTTHLPDHDLILTIAARPVDPRDEPTLPDAPDTSAIFWSSDFARAIGIGAGSAAILAVLIYNRKRLHRLIRRHRS